MCPDMKWENQVTSVYNKLNKLKNNLYNKTT